ncbi:LytTR family transcriptional regulator DNA-binding domain-containing protein [Lactiplantibacillus plantarum]|uniref:LytTR family transcriptional regulator DNA-binding domain-containing protein n=1 Tax=Lactiplantibacillus plantarum TaxID=1590 RepID=UPI0021CB07A1|nr:LytTR family transcriptional regulator DNA-binding domain-containing protein [Lactiplantibacillus plantarum]
MLSTNKERPGSIRLTAKNKVADFPGDLNSFEINTHQFFRCDKSSLINIDYVIVMIIKKKSLP